MKYGPAFLAIGAIAVIFASSGCSKFGSNASSDTFRYILPDSPNSLDPALSRDVVSGYVITQVFEALVAPDKDGKIVPSLAEKWDVTDGGKTYTFHLKKDVKFSNGDPFTAEDVKFTFERSCNPAIKSPIAETYLGDIIGVHEVVHSKATEISGIKIIDPLTIEFKIDAPKPYFLGKLAYPLNFIVDHKVAKKDKQMTEPEELIATGPYKIVKFTENQQVDLDANENYREGKPKIAHIHMPILKDAIGRMNAFKAGDADLLLLTQKFVPQVKEDSKLAPNLVQFEQPYVSYIAMNKFVYKPFASRGVRRAIEMAIDRKNIVDSVLAGVPALAQGILPGSVLGHRDHTAILPYDPEKAKQELAAAGFKGESMLPIDILFNQKNEDTQLVVQQIQSDLKKNLGITVNVKPLDFNTFLDKQERKEIGCYVLAWVADYTDPQNFISLLLTTTSEDNRSRYSNAEVDRLCAEADVMPVADDPKRLAKYAQAEDIILDEAGFIPLYHSREAWLVNSRVKGAVHNYAGWMQFKNVTLDGK